MHQPKMIMLYKWLTNQGENPILYMNSKTELNIAENRNHLNYSKWIYVKRILWTFGKFFP